MTGASPSTSSAGGQQEGGGTAQEDPCALRGRQAGGADVLPD